jgi:hypothetical protein
MGKVASLYSAFPVVEVHDVMGISHPAVRTRHILHPSKPLLFAAAILEDALNIPLAVLAVVFLGVFPATVLAV